MAPALYQGENRLNRNQNTITAMTTTYSNSALAPQSIGLNEVKTALLEPALVVGAAIFWVAALPFVALSLMAVKIWDTLKALGSGSSVRPNPLILRSGLAKGSLTVRSSARTARI
ncbi:MAG TPA: hypothetical protein VGL24_01485 [Chthoniobacterales bacterium]|jgi:uncharacterized membrane protein YqjE